MFDIFKLSMKLFALTVYENRDQSSVLWLGVVQLGLFDVHQYAVFIFKQHFNAFQSLTGNIFAELCSEWIIGVFNKLPCFDNAH